MVILSKKRMMLILTCIFISMFTYFLGMNTKETTIQTVGLPVSGKVVVLDAGHRTEKMKVHNQKMAQQKRKLI